ncbi:preprotein translocase subunit SecY, partial [SAR202 cluster bacterium AD-804-J14_MRT_500m]|nr:preprotein translocase subunit SecY [SAR202 cluster bacterium AD-804-J14_MRT_500m]
MAREVEGRPRLLQAALDSLRVPDLRSRILFTFAMLAIFRLVAQVPIPGVDQASLDNLFERVQLLGFLDLFSGGALRNMSVAALGVFPYITASIVMQLLVPVIPRLQQISREGEQGRQTINRIVHWGTVPIAMAQAWGQLLLLRNAGVLDNIGLSGEALLPTIAAVLSMTAGVMFLVWLGELITERGIGNGISLIIFAGIVAGFPGLIQRGFLSNDNAAGLFGFIVIGILIIALVVVFNEAHRRIPVQYGRSIFRSGRMYRQSGSSYLPIRVNSAGVIPLIFASSVVILPGTIATFMADSSGVLGDIAGWFATHLSPGFGLYWAAYGFLTIVFAFFYTMITFQQQNL